MKVKSGRSAATTPNGRRPPICTVWQLDADQAAPRIIAASFGGIMIKEHDCVVLTSDLPSAGLLSGDVGGRYPLNSAAAPGNAVC